MSQFKSALLNTQAGSLFDRFKRPGTPKPVEKTWTCYTKRSQPSPGAVAYYFYDQPNFPRNEVKVYTKDNSEHPLYLVLTYLAEMAYDPKDEKKVLSTKDKGKLMQVLKDKFGITELVPQRTPVQV